MAKETERALARAPMPWVGGFLIFGGHAEHVAGLTRALRDRAERPLRIASDMERGAGQQVQGLSDSPDLGVLGVGADPDQVRVLARAVGSDAHAVGIDIVFGPVADVRSDPRNPIVGTRSFGWDPEMVAQLCRPYVQGLHDGGAMAVVKHFPGHGPTAHDSHDAVPRIEAEATCLEMRDLWPFQAAIETGACRGLMTGHLSVPALDPTGDIATFSQPMIDRVRAWRGGEDVVVFTDALLMAGALDAGSETLAARRALLAGCDVLLYPDSPEEVAKTLLATDDDERRALLECAERAADRIARAPVYDPIGPRREVFSTALAVARRALLRCGVSRPSSVQSLLIIDDDGASACGARLAAAADGAGVAWTRYQPTADESLPPPPSVGAVAVVFARARAWKGGVGLSEAGVAAARRWHEQGATVIWCAPARATPGPLVPGGGAAVETALAEVLFELPT